MEELGINHQQPLIKPLATNQTEQLIIDCLSGGPASLSTIANQSKLSTETINQHLTRLELSGIVTCKGNNIWVLG